MEENQICQDNLAICASDMKCRNLIKRSPNKVIEPTCVGKRGVAWSQYSVFLEKIVDTVKVSQHSRITGS